MALPAFILFSLSLSLFFFFCASSSWCLTKLHSDPQHPTLAVNKYTHTHAHKHCCHVPKQLWGPDRYKQVIAAHRRQFTVAPLQLSTSIGQDQRYLVDLRKFKGKANTVSFTSSDVTKRMSRGFLHTTSIMWAQTEERNKITETALSCLPAFPGSHSEQHPVVQE